jgi:long-chain acyl-CoA synthetase
MHETDLISPEQAITLPGAFRERVRRTPNQVAYIQYAAESCRWQEYTWADTAAEVSRWQQALQAEGLKPGERVALMLRNCREWVIFDQAAQGLGLVTVPIFTNDQPENVSYILQDAGARVLLIGDNKQWASLREIQDQLAGLARIISLEPVDPAGLDIRVVHAAAWLPDAATGLKTHASDPDALATIVYTSGTTGRSKGVMLSHRNILFNAAGCVDLIPIYTDDLMLSFLPLSHTLERTLGYYLPILAGSRVAYARSVPQLAEDLVTIKPTILISVPRIFERIHARIQAKLEEGPALAARLFQQTVATGWRLFEYRQGRTPWSASLLAWPLLQRLVASKVQARLGGRLRFAVSGGAPLSEEIARLFIGLGVNIQQGYGLTETSPVITANPLHNNIPASVGIPLKGIETKIGKAGELLTRSPCVMLGYWNNPSATRQVLDSEGWLQTGDQARIEGGHIYITGRLKEIIVLATGEKVPPADMEMAITQDGLFEQILIIGEGRPYLSALVVPDRALYSHLLRQLGLDPEQAETTTSEQVTQALLERINDSLHAFPGHARIRRLAIQLEPWSIDQGLVTPTLKLRKSRIMAQYGALIESLYTGH